MMMMMMMIKFPAMTPVGMIMVPTRVSLMPLFNCLPFEILSRSRR